MKLTKQEQKQYLKPVDWQDHVLFHLAEAQRTYPEFPLLKHRTIEEIPTSYTGSVTLSAKGVTLPSHYAKQNFFRFLTQITGIAQENNDLLAKINYLIVNDHGGILINWSIFPSQNEELTIIITFSPEDYVSAQLQRTISYVSIGTIEINDNIPSIIFAHISRIGLDLMHIRALEQEAELRSALLLDQPQ